MIAIDEEELAKEIARNHNYRPKPPSMSLASWSMGQRQIAQAKANGRWRGNNY